MAQVQDPTSGACVLLAARHVFGRSSTCQSRLTSPRVSGLHAELWWHGDLWMIQDLGSRNGTFVNDQKLEAGQEVCLDAGVTLGFGDRHQRWLVLDVEAPRLLAIDHDGIQVEGEYGLLCLPSTEIVEVSIHQDAQHRWVAESEGGISLLEDLDELEAGGRSWRVYLPSPIAPTENSEAKLGKRRTLGDVDLVFTVSRDLENIELAWSVGEGTHTIEARAHGQLLLTLAQARLEDAGLDGLPEAEHGWRHRDELLDMHKIDASLLNLWIHRARKQLSRAGFDRAAQVVERRPMSRQLRIGTGAIQIVQH